MEKDKFYKFERCQTLMVKFDKFNLESLLTFMIQSNESHLQEHSQMKIKNYPSKNIQRLDHSNYHYLNEHEYEFVGFRLLAGFTSVIISEFLIGKTLAKWIFDKAYEKRYVARLLKPQATQKVEWINTQIKKFVKTSIRYNAIIFGSKVLFDQHYAETIKRNQTYYQSNSTLHYKIGALVGLTAYALSIPFSQYQSAKALHKVQTNFVPMNSPEPKNYFQKLKRTWSDFFTPQSLKRMLNSLSFFSMTGIILYRTIYFGGYQNLKSKSNNPVNEYVLAPIGCSALAIIVSPIDQIRFLQMTSHKDKSIFQILSQKGLKLWNLPGQKIYYSIIKQSFAMSVFVAGQNLCNYLIRLKIPTE